MIFLVKALQTDRPTAQKSTPGTERLQLNAVRTLALNAGADEGTSADSRSGHPHINRPKLLMKRNRLVKKSIVDTAF
jgi:hypothetical protein